MRHALTLGMLVLASVPLSAQTRQSLLFTGRFPFVSLDQPNERPGGAITAISAFDISIVTPGTGAFARSWLPATALATMMGNGNNDGDHTRFYKWKTYFERFGFSGPFVRHQDRGKGDARFAFVTIRDESVNKKVDLFINGGTATQPVKPGDWFRFLPNGNTEFFITQALFIKAAGAPPAGRTSVPGADALAQDAAGNLYYSPPFGGHWVSGNNGPANPVFVNHGGIAMIDAADITYDSRGNVLDVVADSAHMLWDSVATGPNGQPSLRGITENAGAYDFNSARISRTTSIPANLVALALDPNGGTITASWPYKSTVFPTVPNLIFGYDNGGYAATIFSTANNAQNQPGSLAVVNGVKCGSDQSTIPADGSWLGTKLDKANFQPTLMGLAVVDEPKTPQFVADAPNDGAIELTDVDVAIDFHTTPLTLVYALIKFGPSAPGTFAPSVKVTSFVIPGTFDDYYMPGVLPYLLVGVTNANGYATWSVPNFYPSLPILKGSTFLWHGVRIDPAVNPPFQLSPPVIQQFK